MTLSKAMRILLKIYEEAKENKYIINPVAYALYHTWKEADKSTAKEPKEEEEMNYEELKKEVKESSLSDTMKKEVLKALADAKDLRNELCLKCGRYEKSHLGACDDCRWQNL